jgi:D-alanyl-D-alanine dipeptidase
MDARSESALATVDPGLAKKVRNAADKLAAAGTYILVVSGLRTAAQQNALYEQGRTAPGHIVTNAKAGQSMHNYGLAVDVVPYLSGATGDLNWKPETDQFKAMVAALKAEGLAKRRPARHRIIFPLPSNLGRAGETGIGEVGFSLLLTMRSG